MLTTSHSRAVFSQGARAAEVSGTQVAETGQPCRRYERCGRLKFLGREGAVSVTSRTRQASWLSLALWSALLVLSLSALAWMIVSPPTTARAVRAALPIPSEPLSLEGAYRRGRPDAPVVVVEYSDFECSTCRQFHSGMLPELLRDYVDGGTAQWVFRHFPNERLHPHAKAAATAAECAGAQGAFWPYHDRLFASALATARYSEWAAELALDRARFDACMSVGASRQVGSDLKQAESLGMTVVPSFVIGILRPDGKSVSIVRLYTGVKPLWGYRSGIEESLAKSRERASRGIGG